MSKRPNNLCGCSKPCGCGDDVVLTPLTCTSPECNNPEKCSETFSAECVIYTGDTIANLGITKGMKMSDVVQLLVLALTNPGCIYPTAPCLSVIGLNTVTIAQTTASIGWNAIVGSVTGYQTEYRAVSSSTWLTNPVVTTLTDTIGPLLPNTNYYIRVKTICGSSSCYSNTIQILTKNT